MITAKADNRKRVLIPDAQPGQVFEVVPEGGGNYRLALIKPARKQSSILADLKPLTKEECEQCWGPGSADPEREALEKAMASRPVLPPDE